MELFMVPYVLILVQGYLAFQPATSVLRNCFEHLLHVSSRLSSTSEKHLQLI
ncbi:hypothetical protein Hanom_Chr16g01495061 [Helianthus anomalus]